MKMINIVRDLFIQMAAYPVIAFLIPILQNSFLIINRTYIGLQRNALLSFRIVYNQLLSANINQESSSIPQCTNIIQSIRMHNLLQIYTAMNSLPLVRKQKSITETMAPLYRKISGLKLNDARGKSQVTMDTIRDEFSSLTTCVDNLEAILNNRLEAHERELLAVMKTEMSRMMDDIRKIVKVFNVMIKEKNFNQDLWETKNEVQYFKFEAIRLFQQNKVLRAQIHTLRTEIDGLEFQQKCQLSALKRLAKKLVKQKAKRKAASSYEANESLNKSKIEQLRTSPKNRKRHQSLFTQFNSTIVKVSNQHTPTHAQIELMKNKSHIESTLSQSDKKNPIRRAHLNSEPECRQELSHPTKIQGYSEQVMLFNNAGRSQKIRHLKQRFSLYKKTSLDPKSNQNNEIRNDSPDINNAIITNEKE